MNKIDISIPVPCDVNDPEKILHDRIYLSLWENPGYLPDPVNDSFRSAVIKTAMEICHETGNEDSYIKFCSETITEWMKFDKPKINLKTIKKSKTKIK